MERLGPGRTLRWVTDIYFVVWVAQLQSKLYGVAALHDSPTECRQKSEGQPGEGLRLSNKTLRVSSRDPSVTGSYLWDFEDM